MPSSSDGKAPRGWKIVEEECYERAVAQIGNHQFFDQQLAILIYALHRNPLGFPLAGVGDVRLAKTNLRILGGEIIPSYRLWFMPDPNTRTVALLWVEMAPPEDMGLWDDEEPPF